MELEREAGEEAAFATANRHGIHHREDPPEALGGEVMPHQLRGMKAGGLGAELAPTRPFVPVGRETLGVFPCDRGLHGRSVLPFANGLVVGEGNVAHIQHVLQQLSLIHI